jgi:hypothetical protein
VSSKEYLSASNQLAKDQAVPKIGNWKINDTSFYFDPLGAAQVILAFSAWKEKKCTEACGQMKVDSLSLD